MKSAELKSGVEYGIIPSWDYSSSEKKNPLTSQRRDVVKATLISLDKYAYEVYRATTPDDPTFRLAEKGSRSVGYLAMTLHYGNTPMYWVTRAQDVVAEYATLETRWTTEEAEELRKQEEARKQAEEREAREREAREREERVQKSVLNALRTIIGARVDSIDTDYRYRRNQQGESVRIGTYILDTQTIQILIEKVLEARDLAS